MTYKILLTFDIEDWFQVENFREWIPSSSWSARELRVERNTHLILDLLDSRNNGRGNPDGLSDCKIRATFFMLGWIAERVPGLVQEIYSRGHEIASHGYCHKLCTKMGKEDVKNDIMMSKRLLEDIIGARVFGYRAPSFSIDADTLKVIRECGYLYDSSYNSFQLHNRYGKVALCENERIGIGFRLSESFFELPISNVEIGGSVIPWGGGGYFRVIPLPIFELGCRFILKRNNAQVFYLHAWEMDSAQPVVKDASAARNFRHRVNLQRTHAKLSGFLSHIRHSQFLTCSQYIQNLRQGDETAAAN